MTYNDVLSMPTYERRYFIGLLTKDTVNRQEKMEEMKEKSQTQNSKGSRSTRVSGTALKSKMISGEIPSK